MSILLWIIIEIIMCLIFFVVYQQGRQEFNPLRVNNSIHVNTLVLESLPAQIADHYQQVTTILYTTIYYKYTLPVPSIKFFRQI